jgi:hypothetical protein
MISNSLARNLSGATTHKREFSKGHTCETLSKLGFSLLPLVINSFDNTLLFFNDRDLPVDGRGRRFELFVHYCEDVLERPTSYSSSKSAALGE